MTPLIETDGVRAGQTVRVASRPANVGRTIIVLLADSAERYMTTALFKSA